VQNRLFLRNQLQSFFNPAHSCEFEVNFLAQFIVCGLQLAILFDRQFDEVLVPTNKLRLCPVSETQVASNHVSVCLDVSLKWHSLEQDFLFVVVLEGFRFHVDFGTDFQQVG
jgi:hypothetical protein